MAMLALICLRVFRRIQFHGVIMVKSGLPHEKIYLPARIGSKHLPANVVGDSRKCCGAKDA